MRVVIILLFFPFFILSSDIDYDYDEENIDYYQDKDQDNIERQIYESCEELEGYEKRKYYKDSLEECGSLSKNNINYYRAKNKANPEKHHLGYNYSEYITHFTYSLYYEYFFLKKLYLGGRIGKIKVIYFDESKEGSFITPYIGFDFLDDKARYFSFGFKAGILASSVLKDKVIPTFDICFGVKVSNSFRISLEIGANQHVGLIIGLFI